MTSLLLDKVENTDKCVSEIEAIRAIGAPQHIAIIMDGNRRWARQRGFPDKYGHWKGADVITKLVKFSSRMGVKTLTLYSFSTERNRGY